MLENKLYLAPLLAVSLLLAAFTPDKPRILIIGDSISIGYTHFVQKQLSDKALVFHNPGNAQHTGTGLAKIDAWLGDGKWDIIQFNWGLWDLCYRHPDSKAQGNRDKQNGKITFTVEEYAASLDSLVSILEEKTDAKLIFVATTYVPGNEAGRFTEDVEKYNDAAKVLMKEHSVAVNDLYAQSVTIHKQFGKGPNDVHYTDAGYESLGKLVSDFLEEQMKR